ncbi:large ribosomal subunit protein uL29m-like isoform X1 [Tigriopus californicus]|uniref:large ribosomal subunit protein uL29m-like isoform X1 n=2 Tax=Tigriopus californicus TaxID=6832 RepID=UPI0027DA3E5C|nr:large ribosomal subunit protein uL29m-like isoform X1 [Tigriopus californicus]
MLRCSARKERRKAAKKKDRNPIKVSDGMLSACQALGHLIRHVSNQRASFAPTVMTQGIRHLGTTGKRFDLMEFFDDPKTWGKPKVRVGRAWLKDELRLRSNQDLHQLWYVLLKERNRLLTLQYACKKEVIPMPNEERLDKVDISMENLEEVVRERNRAYWELEVGESGEQERRVLEDSTFAFESEYITQEHPVPFELNEKHREEYRQRFWSGLDEDTKIFYRRYREQAHHDMRQKKYKDLQSGARVLRRFPDVNEEALQEKYPHASVEEMRRYKDALGNKSNTDVNF